MSVRVVCTTCDLYSRLIPGFTEFLAKNWPDRPWNLVVVTGTEQPWLEGLPFGFWYYGEVDLYWASNMIRFLEANDDELILLLLDDYYLSEPADHETVVAIMELMQADSSIGYVNLRPWTDDVLDGQQWQVWQQVSDHPLVGEYDKANAKYLLSLQPGIWRTSFLRQLLADGEDHWITERAGTERARVTEGRMFACLTDFPLSYCNITRYGVYRDGSREWLVDQLGEDAPLIASLDEMLKERIRGCW